MKFPLALLIIIICFFSCKKESPDTTALNATLAGKWELRSETDAAGTGATLSIPAGNGDIYLFNQNGTYTHYTAGQVYDSGTYTVQLNVTDVSFGGAKVDFIRFSGKKLVEPPPAS